MTPSNPSPDTGAGTPHVFDHEGTARHHHHDQTGDPVWWLGCEQFGGDRREHQHAARSRPATDPAGLDVERLAKAIAASTYRVEVTTDYNRGMDAAVGLPRIHEETTAERIAAEYARLSVADGPGPEERLGVCGSCGTPDHYAGDRTHPCLPVHREETGRS